MEGYAFVWQREIVLESLELDGSRLGVDIPNVNSVELCSSLISVQKKSITSLLLVLVLT